MAAPLFIAIAGSVTTLQSTPSRRVLAARGAVILGLGYVLNVLTPCWFTPSSWYVLHLIGAGLMIATILHRWSNRNVLLAAVCVTLLSAVLQAHLNTPLSMGNVRMSDGSLPGGALRLMMVEGHFPLFPWLSLFLIGMVCGRWLQQGMTRAVLHTALLLIVSGLVLSAAGYLLKPEGGVLLRLLRLSDRFYPLFTPLQCLLWGGALLLLYAAFRHAHCGEVCQVIAAAGRSSLTLFVLHIVVVKQGGHLFGFYRIFSTSVALLLTLIILGGSLVISHAFLFRRPRGVGLGRLVRLMSSSFCKQGNTYD
jgi:uncharacterized membrane protein